MTIIHGDALKKELLKEKSIDLIITSPPYNIGIKYNKYNDAISYDEYLEFTKTYLSNLYFWAKSDGRLCLNIPLDKNSGGRQAVYADIVTIAKHIGWQYHSTIIWNEQNISKRTAWGSWLSASALYVIAPVEMIVVFYKETWKKQKKGVSTITKEEFLSWTNGVWSFKGESKKRIGHPAVFPRELPRRCIKLFSYEGDVILDPFMGSGTTLIEAAINKREPIGIEIDEKYIKLATKRIQQELGDFCNSIEIINE